MFFCLFIHFKDYFITSKRIFEVSVVVDVGDYYVFKFFYFNARQGYFLNTLNM